MSRLFGIVLLVVMVQVSLSFAESADMDIRLPCDPETPWLEICQPGWKSKLPRTFHDEVPLARSGDPQKLARLAVKYVDKRPDPDQAVVLMVLAMSQAVLRGSPDDTYEVGWALQYMDENLSKKKRGKFGRTLFSPSARQRPIFFDLVTDACRRGHARACYDVAEIYRSGDYGVPKDPELAAGIYWRAIDYIRGVRNYFSRTGSEHEMIDGLDAHWAARKERLAVMRLGRLCQKVRFKDDLVCDGFARGFLSDIVEEYGKESRIGRSALKLLTFPK